MNLFDCRGHCELNTAHHDINTYEIYIKLIAERNTFARPIALEMHPLLVKIDLIFPCIFK